ncbi:restriction endonuclease subunit S (plasmid) [Rhodococcus aetherivorans]|uniref:restriction endonuclease subunit S n=2 Tax=Rhodococcus TaxID=1827 RepID=UPI0026F0ED7D|nr:restriction endonuclease subunit S [Rhodococcus aetherivorans]WKX01766.1 restriction endonuclease subunit S [Rhodococcus aetherivorans]
MEITGNRVVLNLAGADNMKAVRPGDFIIHLRSFQGGIELSEISGKVSTAYTVLTPSASPLNHGYYRHLLKSGIFIEQLVNLTGQLRDGQSINYARFSRLILPFPPLTDQCRIADFLDRETAEIDAMDVELDRLIEALRERRRAVLRTAVLGGELAADASDWLSNLPADWGRVPAWAIFRERGEKSGPDDQHLTPSQTYGVLPQSEYMEITGNRVVLNLTGADNMKAVRPGDFIIHLRSFQGGIELSRVSGKVSNAYTVLVPAVEIENGYFRYLLKTDFFIEQLVNLTDQLRDGQSINYVRFSRLRLPLPPMGEQHRIAAELDQHTARIDDMIADANRLKALLAERRSTLINEFVTGAMEVSA